MGALLDGRMEVAFRKAAKILSWRGSGARGTVSMAHDVFGVCFEFSRNSECERRPFRQKAPFVFMAVCHELVNIVSR